MHPFCSPSCSETDIDEVLQTQKVFSNVSKGEFAKMADLKKAFDMDDEAEICKLVRGLSEVFRR